MKGEEGIDPSPTGSRLGRGIPRVKGVRCGGQGVGCRVLGLGAYRVQGVGCGVSGFGLRVEGFMKPRSPHRIPPANIELPPSMKYSHCAIICYFVMWNI